MDGSTRPAGPCRWALYQTRVGTCFCWIHALKGSTKGRLPPCWGKSCVPLQMRTRNSRTSESSTNESMYDSQLPS
jgi:hypothetical protein